MSASAAPISAERFALAISDLPLSNVYAKAAEIRNSLAHLQQSNEQLQPDADNGDRDCMDAIQENVQVIARMEERLHLLRQEVEKRGCTWDEAEPANVNGEAMDLDEPERATAQAAPNLNHSPGLANGERSQEQTGTIGGNSAPGTNPGEADILAMLQARLRDDDEHGLHL